MAKVVEGKYTIVLSKLVKDKDDVEVSLTDEELETVQSAVEELVDDASIVVEVVAE